MARVQDIVAQRSSDAFVGRAVELGVLLECLARNGPLVVYVHGVAGVGKSTLLDAFATRARAKRGTVIRLDCRTVEPTERGFLHDLCKAIGGSTATTAKVASRLARLGHPVVLTLDTYEVFQLMDTWLRQVFVPALPDNVRILIAGRGAPVVAWQSAPGWHGLFRSLSLEGLNERESIELLHAMGVGELDAHRVNRFARGHPLALRLAASMLQERPGLDIEEAAIPRVVEELTRKYLAEVRDPLTRQSLDASSVVRRTTQSALQAMLPEVAPQDAFERLRALPFVERRRDGLIVHDAVKRAIAATLRSADPSRHRAYRRAAWRHFRAELGAAAGPELWRTTADVLYLIENPVVRGAFFPDETQRFAVEPAIAADSDAILAIAHRHDGLEGAKAIHAWWRSGQRWFSTVRRDAGAVVGFYCMAPPEVVDAKILLADPLAKAWLEYLRRDPVPKDQRVLFIRRWLAIDEGELPSAVQAACWLDIKRAYVALRPSLRRIVTTVRAIQTWAPTITELGFRPLDTTVDMDGAANYTAVLDFGPASVDGWMSGLVAAELGLSEAAKLDETSRELVSDGRRVPLSPREFDVLKYLWNRDGQVVSRTDLRNDVWEPEYDGGSNVVDVVMRGLRRKIGDSAGTIETLRNAGYRLRRS